MTAPSPVQIKQARQDAGQTLAQAAKVVHADLRSWQKWEAGDRKMHPAFWDLYQLRVAKADLQPCENTHTAGRCAGIAPQKIPKTRPEPA